MAKKTKGPSMKQVARVYKKNTKPSNSFSDRATGKSLKSSDGRIPTQEGLRTPSPKLKAKSVTMGGTRGGRGATIKKLGKA